jgi:hypothetical protein
MSEDLIYIYCISDSPLIPESVDGKQNLKCLAFQDLYAIVKFVSPEDFSELNLKKNFTDLTWIDIHARNHISTICELMKNSTVIPFKFGTIFNSKESLGQFIQDYSVSLAENLQNIKGKQEWSLKIYCDRPVLKLQIMEISDDVRNLELEIQKSMPGKAFILKRKKAELVEKEVEKIIRVYGQSCYDKLAVISESTRINSVLPNELTERNDEMILNVSYSVEKVKVNQFLISIDQSQKKYKNSGLTLEVTGPWPLFSFINIKEKLCRKT